MSEEQEQPQSPDNAFAKEFEALQQLASENPLLGLSYGNYLLGLIEGEEKIAAQKGQEYVSSAEGKQDIDSYALRKAMEATGELDPKETRMNILKAEAKLKEIGEREENK